MQNQVNVNFNVLIDKIRQLRDKETGCPWMQKQTLQSIVPHTIEEVYEVADAIEKNSMRELKDELGDLLYSILIYTDMTKEQGDFDLNEVILGLEEKIIRRHPHLFGNNKKQKTLTLEQLEKNWATIKKQESKENCKTDISTSMNIASNLPALSYAQKIQKHVAIQTIDNKKSEDILEDIHKKLLAYKTAILKQEALGDLLFLVVNLIRTNGFDSEQTLRLANRKFVEKFHLL